MSSWAKSPAGGRRAPGAPNGSAQQLRVFRRAAPYPSREERTDDLKDALESYEELEQIQNFSSTVKFDAFKHQPAATPDACTPADRHQALYQKFYRQVLEERKPPDCVVLSVTNEFLDYPKSLSQCLQERGLSVEMLFLPAEAGLTRALQDVRADGCPLCILVEQKNVALSSCTIIIFSESLKIHRNMPKDQALDLVQSQCGLAAGRPPPDPAEAAARASQLVDDFLQREAAARHAIPTATRRLLRLLADGVHLYPEELEAVSEYVASRLEHVEALSTSADGDGTKAPSSLGKPPPLLPTPPGPPQPAAVAGGSPPAPVPLLPTPAFPKSKPPPLLSLHRHPGPLGPPPPRGVPHNLFGPPGGPRGPLLPHPPPFHPRGPHGPRLTPPSLKSSRPPLLSTPGPPLPRLSGPRH